MEAPVKAKMSLVGIDGNAFVIIGTVSAALRRAGATPEQVKQFQSEAMSGDYDHVIQTAIKWTTDEDDAAWYEAETGR